MDQICDFDLFQMGLCGHGGHSVQFGGPQWKLTALGASGVKKGANVHISMSKIISLKLLLIKKK